MNTATIRQQRNSLLRLGGAAVAWLSTSGIVHGLAIALVFVSWLEGKNTTWLFYVAVCISAYLWYRTRTVFARALFVLFLVLTLVSPFVPINVDIRCGDSFAVRWLPVEYDLGYRQHIRDLEAAGNEENKDYLIVRKGMPTFFPLRRSLVIVVPWN